MKIAVLSGKGGTGKTFVSVNLAVASPNAIYVDCDVEEPNGHLFFKPKDTISKDVKVKVPIADFDKCIGCRKCVDFCRFNALAHVGGKIKIFDDVCHSCGGCVLLCPEEALCEKERVIGRIQSGISKNVKVLTGILNTGEASGVPIIKMLLEDVLKEKEVTIIDCPPGSACVVMESIKDADFCIMVAEPTIFGVHNLGMIYKLVKLFNKSYGVILNKCMDVYNPSETFCKENEIPILAKISYTTELAKLNANAQIAALEKQEFKELFSDVLTKVLRRCRT